MNSTDIFDLADLVALKPGEKILFVQVKTNQARGKNALEERAEDLFPHSHADLELWVRHDGVNSAKPAAWREFEYDKDGFTKTVDEREEKW